MKKVTKNPYKIRELQKNVTKNVTKKHKLS